jgi:hypothetical protein
VISTSLPNDELYDASLRQGQVKHALKTGLACCLATGVSYLFRMPDGQFAPVFVYLLMTLGMPRPRLNWLLAQLAIAASAAVSAMILVVCRDAHFLYLAVTLLWIFTCMLMANWFPLPAALGAMVSALGIFVFVEGTVGAALSFYLAYGLNFVIAGFSVVVVRTLLWPSNWQDIFLARLAAVYAVLGDYCLRAAGRLRGGDSAAVEILPEILPDMEWAPFRPLLRLLAPELRRARDTSNPFARMILACRSLNLRLWFFNRVIAPAVPASLSAETRQRLASVLDRCGEHLQALLEAALQRKPVLPVDPGLIREVSSLQRDAGQRDSAAQLSAPTAERVEGGVDALLAHGTHATLLYRLVQGIESATESQNSLFASFRRGLAGELVGFRPFMTGGRLLDVQSLRSSTKLVLILLLLLAEEGLLGFPGGSQVAFFATFFASTGNLGRQNKTDLVGLAGLLGGFVYGVAAAFLTSRLPHFPLLLLLVFLGQFVASLAFQKLPRFGAAGVQAGLAIPFAYLATTGPEWGSFSDVRTRFWGLVVAGFTAVVVHAFLWPVLPTRQLRALIAAALRATAESFGQLFEGPRPAWKGAPPSLGETVTQARGLIDDSRYLPGPERADPAYNGVLGCLQEIDANLEYIHLLVGLEDEHPLRQRFFQVIGDYSGQAQINLEAVARQFQPSPRRAAALEPVHWRPDASGRWEGTAHTIDPVLQEQIDPWRPAVIARCLDQTARAVETISGIAHEINLRS